MKGERYCPIRFMKALRNKDPVDCSILNFRMAAVLYAESAAHGSDIFGARVASPSQSGHRRGDRTDVQNEALIVTAKIAPTAKRKDARGRGRKEETKNLRLWGLQG
jgi:hypothetical protein